MKSKLEKDLRSLLDSAYNKGQAYYRKDFYGASEDDDLEWDNYCESGYKKEIKLFIEKYSERKQDV